MVPRRSNEYILNTRALISYSLSSTDLHPHIEQYGCQIHGPNIKWDVHLVIFLIFITIIDSSTILPAEWLYIRALPVILTLT